MSVSCFRNIHYPFFKKFNILFAFEDECSDSAVTTQQLSSAPQPQHTPQTFSDRFVFFFQGPGYRLWGEWHPRQAESEERQLLGRDPGLEVETLNLSWPCCFGEVRFGAVAVHGAFLSSLQNAQAPG